MSAICGGNSTEIWKKLVQSDRTDYRTATYLLLLDRKLRGLSLKITSAMKSHLKQEMVNKIFLKYEIDIFNYTNFILTIEWHKLFTTRSDSQQFYNETRSFSKKQKQSTISNG